MKVKELKMLLNQKDVTDDMDIVCTNPFWGCDIWLHWASVATHREEYWDEDEYEKVFELDIEGRY